MVVSIPSSLQISTEDLSFILIKKREIAVFPLQLLWNLEIRQSNRCSTDLSRNTFYAHYQDIYAVLEELEDDFLSEMNRCLDEAVHNREFFDPLPLLRKFQHFVEDSVETNRLLLANQNAAAFCEKNKAGFYQKSYGKSANHWGKGQRRVLNFSGMCCRRFCQLISKKFEQRIDINFGRDHIRNQSDIHMGFEKIYVIMRLEG